MKAYPIKLDMNKGRLIAVNSPVQGIGQTGRENIVEQAVVEAEGS